jgi:hypothetical protein
MRGPKGNFPLSENEYYVIIENDMDGKARWEASSCGRARRRRFPRRIIFQIFPKMRFPSPVPSFMIR